MTTNFWTWSWVGIQNDKVKTLTWKEMDYFGLPGTCSKIEIIPESVQVKGNVAYGCQKLVK